METNLKQARIYKMIDYLYGNAYLSDIYIIEEDYYPVFEKLYNFFEYANISEMFFTVVSQYISQFISNNINEQNINKFMFISQIENFAILFNKVAEVNKITEEDIIKIKCELRSGEKSLRLTS